MTEEIILQTEKKIAAAVIETDTLVVSSYLSTAYTYTLPDGKIISKKQYISDIAKWWRPLTIDHTHQKVAIYQKTAIVSGKAKYRWKNKNGEIEEAIEQYTDTYIKVKNKWIRVSSHASCLSGRCT
ncbi:MAG: hypothetical protein H7Y04_16680 [Verrucomicrobia bacterium]|nr:hypothetical protein [Cytophagales bacterium]